MTDLEMAIKCLPGHALVLCRDGEVITSDARGVAPMVDFLREGRNLSGFSAADRVVGKAAAMLFVKAGVRAVYAGTVSEGGRALLTAHGVELHCERVTDRILNRDKTGFCPMETLVFQTEDIETGVAMIFEKLDTMRAGR